jgi:hypothetical protein
MKQFILNMGKIIKCDFKPESIVRSIDLNKKGILQNSRQTLKFPLTNKNREISQW